MPIALPAVRDIVVSVNEAVNRELPEATDAGSNPSYTVTGLPAGVTFDDDTLELAGSTTAIGPHWLNYTVTHADASQASRRFTLAVLPITKEWLGGQTPTPADFANHINTPIRYNAGRLGNIYKPAPIKLPGSTPQSVFYVDDEGRIRDIGEGEAGQYVASGGPAAAPYWADFDASMRAERLSWPTTTGGGLSGRGFGITHTANHGLGAVPRVAGLGVVVNRTQYGYTAGDVILFPMGWTGDFAYPRIVWATDTQVRIETPDWTTTFDSPRADNGNTWVNFPQSYLHAAVYVFG